MKKKFFVVVMLVLFSAAIFVACNGKPSFSGKFTQSKYYLSLLQDEQIDFYNELNVKGVEKNKIKSLLQMKIFWLH